MGPGPGAAGALAQAAAAAQLEQLVSERCPGAALEESHFGCLRFRLPAKGLSLARVFEVMEGAKSRQLLAAYSVSQPSLEQVFLSVVGQSCGEGEQQGGGGGGGSSKTV